MKHIPWKTALGTALSAGLIAAPLAAVPAFAVEASPAAAGSSPVIINEAYLSGGSTGAAFKNKFVELYNTSDAPVSLDGWSLQYRSATGTGVPSSVVPLTGTIAAKGFHLLKGGSNGTVGLDLPAADTTATGFNPAIGGGTIVLAKQATAVTNLATGSVVEPANVADLLGYGSSLTFETLAATAPAGTGDVKSLNRSNGVDSNNNSADFSLNATITPKAPNGAAAPVDPPVDPGPVTPPAARTIAEIQGDGVASPLVGTSVVTRGKVTATFPTGGFAGYYIQTPGTGGDLTPANHTASDAIFVFSAATAGSVQIGDYVEVTGAVSEYFGMTQVTVAAAADMKKLTEAAPEVKATGFALPAEEAFREALEGMLLTPQGPVTVTDNYSLNQYGEIGLAGGTTPLEQPTAVAPFGSAEYTATVAANAARGIKLDDGATTNFLKDAGTKALELPYLTTADPVRVGAPVTFKTNVVLNFANGSWKFQPLTHLTPANAEAVQPASFGVTTRTEAPAAVGGNLKIASFNVLNYFPTTGDQLTGCTYYTDRDGNPITVRGGCDARGAANAENLQRQQDKIVAAITKSGADVVSLMEIENSAQFGKNRDDALAKLVDALNIATPGIWDYVRTPANAPPLADEDMIRTAFIFKKSAAEPVGESIIHNDTVAFANARKPLAQVFKPVGAADDKKFIAIANHFKSKGSAATPEDTDKGQGASNLARTAQAQSLLAFSNELQTAKGTDKVFLIGDFNAYAKEDPINVFTAAGYVNQDEKARNADGSAKHSYLFGGLVGSLDHILASPGANAVVTGADIWNINSVESVALEYSRYNNNVTDYYAPDQFRASDHDPVVVGLDLPATPASVELNFLGINDFHGRIDSNTVFFAGTIEKLRAAAAPGATAFLSAGDNIGASLFASAVAQGPADHRRAERPGAARPRPWATTSSTAAGPTCATASSRAAATPSSRYLGANVYKKGTTEPALPEYTVLDMNGIKVAVIGTVTQENAVAGHPGGHRRPRVRRRRRRHQPRRRQDQGGQPGRRDHRGKPRRRRFRRARRLHPGAGSRRRRPLRQDGHRGHPGCCRDLQRPHPQAVLLGCPGPRR